MPKIKFANYDKMLAELERDVKTLRGLDDEMQRQRKGAKGDEQRRTELDNIRASLDAEIKGLLTVIDKLKAHIAWLASGTFEPDTSAIQIPGRVSGITDGVRKMLKFRRGKSLSPVQIRDELVRRGFFSDSTLLLKVHSTLRRLAKAGEIKAIKAGKTTVYANTQARR